jgi:RNA recognition motif-containing protein
MSSNYSSSRRGAGYQGGRRRPSSPKKPGRPSSPAPVNPPPVSLFKKLLSFIGLGKSIPPKKEFRKSDRSESRSGASKERFPSKTRVSRKPERVEVTSPRLYLGNLSFDATESDLFELFSGVGQVQNVELVANRETHRSKGFGFVQMTTLEEAKRAVDELHDKEYMGRKLVVSGAKALPEMRSESPTAVIAKEPEASVQGEHHCHQETPEQNAANDVTHEGCCHHDSTESCSL